jgi:guanylate kinase
MAMEKNDEFIETASVHGNFYGTAKAGITEIQD